MLNDEYLAEVIAVAKEQSENVEQRAVALLHQRGDMANFTCEGQRQIESRIRELLL